MFIFYFRKKFIFNETDTDNIPKEFESFEIESEENNNLVVIPITQLPSTIAMNKKNLFEITDNTVIARISEIIPKAADITAKSITSNTLKNVELYKAIIPGGATLAKSKQMDGAVRGIYQGAKGIKGQANLIKVDPSKISKATTVANGVTNIMSVGSLVVGQYYMTEINSKLETMNKNIEKISDFQNREFKSRILSLIALVGKVSNFSSEIIESDDLRNRKSQTLDDLEREGTQLLQQVNLTIDEIIKENQIPDYREYQEKVEDFKILLEYQQILLTFLEEISKLTYLLGKGESSSEMCYSIFNIYLEQSNKIRAILETWHNNQVELLGIDIDKNRINKTGIGKILTAIPGIIDDNWNYKSLKDGLGNEINAQKTENQLMGNKPEDLYDNDIQIIIKEGKYYYLHENII